MDIHHDDKIHRNTISSNATASREFYGRWTQLKLWDVILFLNCFIHVPMWSMLINLAVYVAYCYFFYQYSLLRYLLIFYSTWCILDRKMIFCRRMISQQCRERLRHLPGFHLVSHYFPVTLIKTKEISPGGGPYIFLYHPHGIISMGANVALNTNGCFFDQTFPGIVRWAVTLNVCFCLPLFREWITILGFIGADRRTLVTVLQKQGDSLVLVPGGAVEALYTDHNKFRLVGSRRGFIRLALETGAKPVPVLGFGENQAFAVAKPSEPGSKMFMLQRSLCKLLSFSTPILTSPFPQRKPIHVVVGQPIVFNSLQAKLTGKTLEEACFQEYKLALENLYNEHKSMYGYDDVDVEWLG